MTSPRPEPGAPPLGFVAMGLLALLPTAHLVLVPVAGALAGGADLVVAFAVLTGGALLFATGRPPFRLATEAPFLLLLGFAAFAGVTALWSPTPSYALVKGAGYAGLGAAAWLVARSEVEWERAADAWLVGTALALGVTAVGIAFLALLGGAGGGSLSPDGSAIELGPMSLLGERVVYRGGAVEGIGFPRLRGPFSHPNLFGEYLLVSGVFLWGRWDAWVGRRPVAARGFALGLAGAMIAAVPSASFALGPAVAAAGWFRLRGARDRGADPGAAIRAPARLALLAGGAFTLAAGVGLLFPLDLAIGPFSVATNGIRPRMWAAAAAAFVESPVLGMGATPFPVRLVSAGPTGSEVVGLWEAHSVYLGVAAQFGLVGSAFLAGAVAVLVRGVLRVVRDPSTSATLRRGSVTVLVALVVVGAHGVFSGSEDFRHVWLVFGLVGLVIAERGRG